MKRAHLNVDIFISCPTTEIRSIILGKKEKNIKKNKEEEEREKKKNGIRFYLYCF